MARLLVVSGWSITARSSNAWIKHRSDCRPGAWRRRSRCSMTELPSDARRHHLAPTRQRKRRERSARWIKACADAEDLPDQAIPRGNKRPHWKDQALLQFRDRCRSSARFGLSGADVSSGRDRRRALLGGTWAIRRSSRSFMRCDNRDVVIIHINPLERAKLPTTASEIMNRINEIRFNFSLMPEMRAIAFVTKLIDEGKISDNSMKRMLIHGIEATDVMAELSTLNKLNADWDNLTYLMQLGCERADAWLERNFDRLGKDSTV